MVNASLNWASIVGIVLAVGGAGLYFLRSFKPALARDYDVFFAAIGLLCGGILFFQGWRLDPILQFGQFLLAGTTVFFAYESVRLRGVATDQARRSSYFDDEPIPEAMPSAGFRDRWSDSYDRFEESPLQRRRFSGRDDDDRSTISDDDLYRPSRPSRPAIPEQAVSRRIPNRKPENSWKEDSERSRRMARFGSPNEDSSSFGERRTSRQVQRRGSRPQSNPETTGGMRGRIKNNTAVPTSDQDRSSSTRTAAARESTSMGRRRNAAEDAAFSPSRTSSRAKGPNRASDRQANDSFRSSSQSSRSSRRRSMPRDNSSRFDD